MRTLTEKQLMAWSGNGIPKGHEKGANLHRDCCSLSMSLPINPNVRTNLTGARPPVALVVSKGGDYA